jgi:predicted aldo/keto reductase-like oxidoreductase
MDCAGIDDNEMALKVKEYIENNRDQIIPIFLISPGTGGAHVESYERLKNIISEMKDFNPTVIFTQFDNMINNITVEMHNDGIDVYDAESYI